MHSSMSKCAVAGAILALCSAAWAAPRLVSAGGDATYLDDAATGDVTVLANPAGATTATPEIVALATDPRTDAVYGIDLGDFLSSRVSLLELDSTGHVIASQPITYQGQPVPLAEALAFTPRGTLYVSFRLATDAGAGTVSGHVAVLDPATAAIDPATAISLSGGTQNDGDALEFIDGTLYLLDTSANIGTYLFTVDLNSGALTKIDQIFVGGAAYQVNDVAWDGHELFAEGYAIADRADGKLLVIDPATARGTLVGPSTSRPTMDGLTILHHGKRCDSGDDDCGPSRRPR